MSYLLAALSAAALVSGCATTLPGLDFEYQEKIVISGMLLAGDTVRNINVARTLPPTEKIDYSKAGLPDAKVTLFVDGQAYPMKLQIFVKQTPDSTMFLPQHAEQKTLFGAPGLVVESGKRYEIAVEWNGKQAKAATFAPAPPQTDSVFAFSTTTTNRWTLVSESVGAVVRARANEAYLVIGKIIAEETNLYDFSRYTSTNTGNSPLLTGENAVFLTLSAQPLASLVESKPVVKERVVYVFAYDKAYYDYVSTRERSRPPTEEFFSGGANTLWNVAGDGIGIFVGAAVTRIPINK